MKLLKVKCEDAPISMAKKKQLAKQGAKKAKDTSKKILDLYQFVAQVDKETDFDKYEKFKRLKKMAKELSKVSTGVFYWEDILKKLDKED